MINLAGKLDAAFERHLLCDVYERTHRLARAFGVHYLAKSSDPALNFVHQNWHLVADHIRVCPFRAATLIMHIVALRENGPGTVAEFGVSSGGSLALMSLAAKSFSIPLKFVGFDTFHGLPTPNQLYDSGYSEGQFAAPREVTLDLLNHLGIEMSTVTLIQGDVRHFETFDFLDLKLAHLDLDLFEPTLFVLRQIKTMELSPTLVLDDVFDNSGGALRALRMENLNARAGPTGQAIHHAIGTCSFGDLWKCYAAFLGDCRTALPPVERLPLEEYSRLLKRAIQ